MSFESIAVRMAAVLLDWVEDPVARSAILCRIWSRAVGPAVARRTEAHGLADGVLRVEVLDTAWGKVLEEMAPELLAKLNAALGRPLVRKIEWR
ncbi:MAG: DciA family protein [Acidobacteriota bacterium]